MRRTDVHHVQQQIRLDHLLQRGLERIDQIMRQLANETHRVRKQHVLIGRQAQSARGRVQRGEQLVLRQGRRPGDGIEQRRLAGVGVANQRSQRPLVAFAPRTLHITLAHDQLEVALNFVDPLADFPAVHLQLAFTLAAAHPDTAFLP